MPAAASKQQTTVSAGWTPTVIGTGTPAYGIPSVDNTRVDELGKRAYMV